MISLSETPADLPVIDASVIIPARDVARTVDDQLRALQAQSCAHPFEVIVVENGSRDDTWVVLRDWEARFPGLRVLGFDGAPGAAAGRNEGIRHARGDKLLFCDADDVVERGWVAAMSMALEDDDIVGGRLDMASLGSSWSSVARDEDQDHELPSAAPGWFHIGGGNLGVRRSVIEAVGMFDETLPALSDTEFCYRAQTAGYRLSFVDDAVVRVRVRPSLRSLYRQGRGWGESTVELRRRFRAHGLPPLSILRLTAAWMLAFPRLLLIGNRAAFARWVHRHGWRVGLLRGLVRSGLRRS